VRAVKKLKLVHVKLIRSLHHEGIAAADQLSANARDVSKLPRGALALANLDRAAGAYDWCAAQSRPALGLVARAGPLRRDAFVAQAASVFLHT
jgi:hypothetical protein